MTRVTCHPDTWEIVCRTCNEAKVRESFQTYRSGNLRAECRSCVSRKRQPSKREWERRQRVIDPEAVRLADRLRYQRERDVRLERARRYHRDHRDERSEQSRSWRERNADALTKYRRDYNVANRERINEAAREYRRRKRTERDANNAV